MTGSTSRDAILLERRYAAVFGTIDDDELVALAIALGDELRDALARSLGLPAGCFDDTVGLGARIREAMASRRAFVDAGVLLSEPAVEATIEVLGDRSDDPSLEDLEGVLPDIIERFGLTATRLMATQYSVSLGGFRKLTTTDERFAIPTTSGSAPTTAADTAGDDVDREATRRARAERKAREREQRARAEEQRRTARRGRR
jgi:hypothetical protein